MPEIPTREEEAVAKPTECPRCHQVAVVFDYLEGFSVCEACGRILNDEELVPQNEYYNNTSIPSGVFVGAKDSGLAAAAATFGGSAVATRVLGGRYRPEIPWEKLKQHLEKLVNALDLPAPVAKEAESYLERLHKDTSRAWRREEITAAAVYVAIRLNNLPLTLLDLAKVTHLGLHAMGKSYHLATAALGMRPPHAQAQTVLERSLNKVLKDTDTTEIGRLLGDATAVLAWADQQLVIGTSHPIVNVAASIVIALEMNNVAVGFDYVGNVLILGLDSLQERLGKIKAKLLSYSKLLPYSAMITKSNVFSHARAIIRLTRVLQKESEANETPLAGSASAMLIAAQQQAEEEEEANELQPGPVKRRCVRFEEDIAHGDAGVKVPSRAPDGGDVAMRKPSATMSPSQQEDDAELCSDLDMSDDDDLDVYLRTPAEVEAYQEIFEAITADAPSREKKDTRKVK